MCACSWQALRQLFVQISYEWDSFVSIVRRSCHDRMYECFDQTSITIISYGSLNTQESKITFFQITLKTSQIHLINSNLGCFDVLNALRQNNGNGLSERMNENVKFRTLNTKTQKIRPCFRVAREHRHTETHYWNSKLSYDCFMVWKRMKA